MKHIVRIKEGIFLTEISLIDDENKKSRILYNSMEFRKVRNGMGIDRQLNKLKRIVDMYNMVSKKSEDITVFDLKEDSNERISTVAILAIEKAMKKFKLEKNTVKEILDKFVEEYDIRKEKNKNTLDDLKFDVDETEAVKNLEQNIKEGILDNKDKKQDEEDKSENR